MQETTGKPLEALISLCEQRMEQKQKECDNLRETELSLKESQIRLTRTEEELKAVKNELPAWFDEWKKAIDGLLSLKPDVHPETATEIFDNLVLFFQKLDQSEELRKRLYGMDKAKEDFHLADIARHGERYLRFQIGALILKQQIEAYRKENQAPVLGRAGDLFSRLTLGSYAGQRDELAASGKPILLGVRPDNQKVAVDGMSDGTRDQLYLALRLATLEQHMKKEEPMPFVVVTFSSVLMMIEPGSGLPGSSGSVINKHSGTAFHPPSTGAGIGKQLQ